MSNEIKVSISDYKVSESPDKLITLGLGSCVGVAIYDKITKVGGLSHIMLPDSSFFNGNIKPEKFADLAIPMMVKEITKGRKNSNLIAKIAGGASMFNFPDKKDNDSIGSRNVMAVSTTLKSLGIPVISSDTGGKIGRTMIVNLDDFSVNIRTANREIITL
ncbi:chemotaxis protein CheD [Tissierella sp. Yu-01]|uniref:chemotaxis protein CheD n=1 Tax=Tissierella sp. Yu-01 TaxID=3035694 RepID=UPI00240E2D3D|nr:chemotaxis protein CheD [Tissierella sp. Yu-01]WFA07937.1 chemotaxis protein CheD [Tissierella sp. Yu-01]